MFSPKETAPLSPSRHNASGPGIGRGRFLARAPWQRFRLSWDIYHHCNTGLLKIMKPTCFSICMHIYICVFYIHMFIDIYSDKIHMLHDNIHTSYMINCMYIIYIHICVWRICFHVYWHRFLFSSRAHGQVSGLCTSWRRSLLGTTSWKIIGPNGAFFSKTHTVT